MSQAKKEFWGRGLVDVLQEHAEEERGDAWGYKFFRNGSFVGLTALTGFMNMSAEINSMSPKDQLMFNATGLSVALISATGFERGRRKMERSADNKDRLAEEIASFDQ